MPHKKSNAATANRSRRGERAMSRTIRTNQRVARELRLKGTREFRFLESNEMIRRRRKKVRKLSNLTKNAIAVPL